MLLSTWGYKYLLETFFTSFAYRPRSGIARSLGNSRINFLRNCHTVPTATAPLYIPTSIAQGLQFLHILISAYYCCQIIAIPVGVAHIFLKLMPNTSELPLFLCGSLLRLLWAERWKFPHLLRNDGTRGVTQVTACPEGRAQVPVARGNTK